MKRPCTSHKTPRGTPRNFVFFSGHCAFYKSWYNHPGHSDEPNERQAKASGCIELQGVVDGFAYERARASTFNLN